ncbi:MAG TPA: MBL fold hydrolase, partial [Eubacteriaceae bacterium]|nr:MBL fold hydrolase [Eubacteriaceae bacterium]
GSPTIGNSILHTVAAFTHYVKMMKFKKKKAAAFGCYGWSGECV